MKTNYKSKFGITLIEAKKIAQQTIGRLPRPGYETMIQHGIDTHGRKFEIYLVNRAGSFYLRKWTSPF